MIKKINLKLLCGMVCFLAGVLAGCDLSRQPNDQINLEESISTLSGAQQWDNGTYTTLRTMFGGNYIIPQEVQADMLHVTSIGRNSNVLSFHIWDLRNDNEIIKGLYHSYYSALKDVNIIIAKAPNIVTEAEEDQVKLQHIIGNAHFARAFYYLNLALRWGAQYKPESAERDLCVPLMLEFNPLLKLPRATNAKVYTQILEDLKIAEEKLSDIPGKEGSDVITVDVVKALRARTLLYMADMEGALKAAEELINSGVYPLIGAPTHLSLTGSNTTAATTKTEDDPFVQMWHHDSGKEQIFQPFINKPHELPSPVSFYNADQSAYDYQMTLKDGKDVQINSPSYLPSQDILTLCNEKDRRRAVYFEQSHISLSGQDIHGPVMVISKFKGNPKYKDLAHKHWGGYVPNGIQAPKPFRIAEQYLIAAEAAYKLKQTNKSLQHLNALRVSRGSAPLSHLGLLWEAITQERQIELAFEGFRLFDLRRWEDNMTRQKPQLEGTSKTAPWFDEQYNRTMRKESDDHQFIWGFPIEELKINNKIVQNPGW